MRFVFAWPLLALCLFAVGCNNDVAVQLSSCSNKVSDGTESDVDCGGSCPTACADGKSCREPKDCASGGCVDQKCVPAAPPVVSAVEPWGGPIEGGTTVKLTGTGFAGAMTVRFGPAEATGVTVVSATELSAKTPAGAAGPVDVTVVGASGVSSAIQRGFVYADGPSGPLAVTSVVPSSGGMAGGTRGVLSGAGFDAAAKLYFGGVAATQAKVLDDKRIVFTTPANRAGRVDLLVVNPGAQAARMARGFEYFAALGPAPKVVGVFPSRIAVGSSSTLEATGEHLGDGSLVFVGDEPATVKTASDGSVSFLLPPGLPAGTYEVTVTTRDGQTVTLTDALEVLAASCGDAVANGAETDVDCGGACPACADALKCAVGRDCLSQVCSGGLCLSSTCTDAVKNGDETDVDCGGSCGPCGDMKGCANAKNCKSGVCARGLCQVPACNDGVKNGLESDLDCGGDCPACAAALACLVPADCRSLVCTGELCVAATCFDLVANGSESDVDCGGTCEHCGPAKKCGAPGDCSSGVCTNGRCQVPTCSDRARNGSETDIDCGGSCDACGVGRGCVVGGNCTSFYCAGGVCVVPRCDDKVKNGSESDVDCGGSCGGCTNGSVCAVAGDCSSLVCTGGICQAAVCTDKMKNGSETDIDCGGLTCSGCGVTKSCLLARDCAANVCTGGVCQAALCTDKVKNGSETDIDCGGSCGGCSSAQHCMDAADCLSSVCSGSICQAAICTDKVKNGSESDVDCGGSCGGCTNGSVCAVAGDCSSLVCTGGICQAALCTDKMKNGSETDVDCGGGTCARCAAGLACAIASDCASGSCISGQCTVAAIDCAHSQSSTSGIFLIDPDGSGPLPPQNVYCDMTTDGGGWRIVSRVTTLVAAYSLGGAASGTLGGAAWNSVATSATFSKILFKYNGMSVTKTLSATQTYNAAGARNATTDSQAFEYILRDHHNAVQHICLGPLSDGYGGLGGDICTKVYSWGADNGLLGYGLGTAMNVDVNFDDRPAFFWANAVVATGANTTISAFDVGIQ